MDVLRQTLQNAEQLPDLTLTTSLPSVLNGTASNLDVARSLLAISAVLLSLLAAAALLAVARLLAGQREGESAMLTARGATRWQLVRLTAAEAIPLCLLSAAAGGVAGVLLARLLAGTGSAGDDWPAIAVAAVVAAGAVVIMVVPALSTVTPGTARARRGRQAAISGLTKAGADVALVLLAVVAGWQLRHYSAVSAGANGNFGVDPVIVIAPALALVGGTVLALRLLPVGGKAGDRLAARGRRLTAALASWQISRQPIRQGGAALLIVLAVATGTLALAQRQSWTRSDHDQAAFGAGADVRVETSQPLSAAQAAALVQLPGVRHAMPVAMFAETATGGETLAIGSAQAANVTLLRSDQSPVPAAQLFGKISPGRAGQRGHAARPHGRIPAHRRARPRIAGIGPGHGERIGRGRRQRGLPARRGHAARRRPAPYADRDLRQPSRPDHSRPNHWRPNHSRPNHRGHRGQRGFWGREGHLPGAADRGQPGLHAARQPVPGPRLPSPWTACPAARGRRRSPAWRCAAGPPPPRPPNWRASGRPSARAARPARPRSRPRVSLAAARWR